MTEIFKLSNSGSKGGERGPPKSTELISSSDPGIYEFPDYSLIYYPYKFDPVQNIVNATTFIPRETHLYNRQNKEFHIRFFSQQNIDSEYAQKVVEPSLGSDEDNINANPSRNANENRLVNFALTNDTTKADKYTINDAILHRIFHGHKLTFNCKGITSRRSMRFICIEPSSQGTQSPHESKILGQYLILKVAHIFNEGQYTNTIQAVTPNNIKPLNQPTT